jgi:hypothetical protein
MLQPLKAAVSHLTILYNNLAKMLTKLECSV